ncbi:ubiquitin-protein ligase [Novymonas esmeraldas]|uniref:Ubiquitin-protein ligase n=1 Tax=Novymonas esmeraldas TaxID=1808958 RepID=A0AAW0EQJ2_9TRYP
MDVGVYDPKAQVRAVAAELKGMDMARLFEAVDVMSTSLVMGFERYLRKFDSETAIPLLADVCETFIGEAVAGDLLVITLRALSLIMEHVPSSYDAAHGFHAPLMKLSSRAIHRSLCMEWKYAQSNNASMVEEGLRVMRFVSKDDMTGELIQHALVGDLLTLCMDPQPLVARQALETLLMMSSKVVMPSELEKPTLSVAAGIFSFFKSKKKTLRGEAGRGGRSSNSVGGAGASAAAGEDVVPHVDHPTVVQVENVIAPLLVALVEQYTKSLASIPEHWALLELSLQCLGTLIERALICHRPHTARALASPLLPRILFQLIVDTEANVALEPGVRVDRVLLCETTLTVMTSCHRNLMLESLQLPEAQRFFRLILDDSSDEITSLLEDPFPRAVIATRSTQRRDKDHITSIAALQLFVLACPTVPPDAFGLKPKLVLPVHQWMWEDELRHNNRLIEEQCVSLETSWTRLEHRASISVHLKELSADLRTMSMSKGTRGGHRNICRSYVPFVYHFADEVALRPIVAVKEAGPCAVDGTMLVWRSATSATNGAHVTASVTVAREEDGAGSGASSAKRSRRRGGASTPRASSEGGATITPASASPAVVLNTQLNVPAQHISLAEGYFSSLCLFAKNTSGQMAKQVATCACASMLQLMFLSGASERFEELMEVAVLPMCEMYREALISADKATKAVVLTMIEWMLYHPMAEPCEFTESALRCGLLDQLDILSKTTLLVRDKPTRTSTLAEKASALAGCIVEKIKDRRAAYAGGVGTNANVASNTALGGAFLSTTMLKAQKALDELRRGGRGGSSGGGVGVAAAAGQQPNGARVERASRERADTHEGAIRELLRIFHESSDITAYEVFNVGAASALLYYLLGDRTLEELVGDTVVFASGASASTFTHETVAQPGVSTGPVGRNASSWAAMMASGMHVADVLAMYVVEKRMRCFIQCAVAYPAGMRRLVSALVSNLPLQSHLPLVESVVTYDKVVCKTPLQAHQALCMIAPLITLCGDAGRRISAAIKTTSSPGDGVPPLPRSGATTTGTTAAGASESSTRERKTSSLASSSARSAADSAKTNNTAVVARIARECCMVGHRLRYVERHPQMRRCDKCNRHLFSSHSCRTCNYDVCEQCYSSYTGNVELIKSLAAMERNRVHLCVTIGDLERWFRTGSTSTKGTELAPTSQSSLNHLERFTTRVLTFLKRYAATGDATAAVPATPFLPPAKASATAAAASVPVELAEKLLRHPDVVRRLTYKYLSRFATRGTLMDEGAPITGEQAAAMDAEVEKVLDAAEHQAAEALVEEAVEERYILYRTSCGMLPFQETVLSTLYRRAFALGDHQVLLQLENCLLRLDGGVEEPLTMRSESAVTVANPAASASRRHHNVKVTKKARSVLTPLAVVGGGSFSAATAAASGQPVMTSVEKSTEAREFEGHRVALDQTYVFHHFESDSAAHCACGCHSRAEFHTKEPPALTFTSPDFAHRADMLLLILLHRALFEETHGLVAYAAEAKCIFGGDDSLFENTTITTALVRSLEASALRVSMLPPRYALPRWVNFLLREGRFLIPRSVRERVARFLAYGARRAFTQHMRVFRNQRNDRAVSIFPGEWAKLSNHKFSVSRETFLRDAYTMLRKCSDARFPISVEFKGDIGVGQGPTAQFYTLLATEASKRTAELWRVSGEKVPAGHGLRNGSSHSSVISGSLASVANTASPAHHSAVFTQVESPLIIGAPPSTLPPRRSSVTPTASPARSSAPSSIVAGGRAGALSLPSYGTTATAAAAAAAAPAASPSPARAAVHADPVHRVPSSTTRSPGVPLTPAAVEADAGVVVPPREGLYPRHLAGVRRYADEVESVPTTPLLRRSHSRTLRDESATLVLSASCSGQSSTTATRKALHLADPAASFTTTAAASTTATPTMAATVPADGHLRSGSFATSAVQYDLTKAALLVDSNVGLLRDYVLEQRERAKAYYVVGAALGRAFIDGQVFPLPLSPALAFFIRRGVPAYHCVLSDVTHIDPPPEFPIDLFELPLTAASWVDQDIAQSLASLSTMDSATLAALDLPFTLPGDDSFELLPGGAQLSVTKANLRLYQRRVVGALLYESVAVPLYFLTMGCRDVVPPEALTVMEVGELIGVLGGEDKNPDEPLWTTDEIRAVLVGDHGYQNDSPQLGLLAKVLGQRLTPAEQRAFLFFCTGCPRLPLGGIRALGAITVVKRSNAFAEARTAALRAEASAAATGDSGIGGSGSGGGQLDMEGEEEEDGGPLGALYEPTAQSDVEETSSGRHETPRRVLSSICPAASEEAAAMSVALEAELPESEWALPSVNTCFRYLKLPPYPNADLLYRKLMMSITQAGGSFELS